MADNLNSEQRSYTMRQVHSGDTGPEMFVRKLIHRQGLRFRLHAKNLPGRPDIILPKFRVAIFVHGCFWHRHKDCLRATTPKTNEAYWLAKFARNVNRDKAVTSSLESEGWRVLTIWECETRQPLRLKRRILQFFRLIVV